MRIKIGDKLGRLEVIGRGLDKVYTSPTTCRVTKYPIWKCECSCGNIIEVLYSDLLRKDGKATVSCGCQRNENFAHRTHGLRHHPLYHVLVGMYDRCYNPKSNVFQYYGGRGISICEQWNKKVVGTHDAIVNFIAWAEQAGYSKGLSIDRMDNDGNYEPDNCRWITMAEQQRNKSRAA